jgi:hypothetical protein
MISIYKLKPKFQKLLQPLLLLLKRKKKKKNQTQSLGNFVFDLGKHPFFLTIKEEVEAIFEI